LFDLSQMLEPSHTTKLFLLNVSGSFNISLHGGSMKRLSIFYVFVGLLSFTAAGDDFHLLAGSQFSAPNVNGTANVGNPQVGDIIFSTANNTFYGYGGSTPGWLAMGGTGSYTAPTVQKFTTGSGTYTLPTPAPLYIRVRMVGGGGGGGGSSTTANNASDGTAGGATTFGTLSAGGGSQGLKGGSNSGGAGGTNTFAGTGLSLVGGAGGGSNSASTGVFTIGGLGGNSAFGGGGGPTSGAAGGAGASNTGGGGAGAGAPSGGSAGGGGGAGGYIEAVIFSPNSTYSYCIGNSGGTCTGGNGGSNGTSGFTGGTGGSGLIVVEEYYQ
jgi:hypothetical protein